MSFLLRPFMENSLVTGRYKNIVSIPEHMQSNHRPEWLASNIFDFFNNLNLIYASLAEFCTPVNCATMSGPNNIEYQWFDQQKRPVRMSAPQYIDLMTTWIQSQFDDEQIFPTKAGMDFPVEFQNLIIRPIYRQLFRLFAHIYHAHYEKCLHLEQERHLNTIFAHFVCFGKEFDLLPDKQRDIGTNLQELIDNYTSEISIKDSTAIDANCDLKADSSTATQDSRRSTASYQSVQSWNAAPAISDNTTSDSSRKSQQN